VAAAPASISSAMRAACGPCPRTLPLRAFAQQFGMAIEQTAERHDVAGMDRPDRFAKPLVADHGPVEQFDDALAVAGRSLARVVERGLAAPVGLPTQRAVPDEQFDQRDRPAARRRM
jgi:hypothetical protein